VNVFLDIGSETSPLVYSSSLRAQNESSCRSQLTLLGTAVAVELFGIALKKWEKPAAMSDSTYGYNTMSHTTKGVSRRRRHLTPPHAPWKVHVDGSYDWQRRRMTYAACVYSPSGRLLLRRLGAHPGGCSAEAEARAALMGICAIRELTNANPPAGWQLIGDHRGIIKMLSPRSAKQCSAARLKPFIDECQRLMGQCDPRWVGRDENFVAHWTASQIRHAIEGTMVDLSCNMGTQLQRARQREQIREAKRIARFGRPDRAAEAKQFLERVAVAA
jgi:hypothetical protein